MSSLKELTPEDEKKAKEYVEGLAAELHHDCYVDKIPEGCHRYAEFLQAVRKEPAEAAKLFRSTCKDMKFPESCVALGNMHLTGKGVQKDFQAALECYDTACEEGSMGGCNNAGLVWQNGLDTQPANFELAAKYFKRSCEGGLRNGCFNLSGMYLQGKGTVAKDMAKALKYSLRSCDLGHPWGCANVSRMYKLGDGVAKDEKRAEEFRAKAKKLKQQYAVSIAPDQ